MGAQLQQLRTEEPAIDAKHTSATTALFIDCDPGMDDALALIVALKTANLRVRAVTSVSGNLPAERCYGNIHTILQLMAAPTSGATGVATGQGGPHPLVRELAHDPFSHGADGLGETGLPAAPLPPVTAYAPNLLVEQARRHAEQGDPLTVVALGPLTNIALALRMEPRLPQLVRRLIVPSAGPSHRRLQREPRAASMPPAHAQQYLRSASGTSTSTPRRRGRCVHWSGSLELVAVGLDVATHRDILRLAHTEADEEDLRASGRAEARLACGMLADFVTGRGFASYCVLIDSKARHRRRGAARSDRNRPGCICDVETLRRTDPRADRAPSLCACSRSPASVDIRDSFRWSAPASGARRPPTPTSLPCAGSSSTRSWPDSRCQSDDSSLRDNPACGR